MIHRIGDMYHKYIFRWYSTFFSFITDRLPFALMDSLFALYYYPAITIMILVGSLIYYLYRIPYEVISSTPSSSNYTQVCVMIVWMVLSIVPLSLRTPYTVKMGITPKKYEVDEELNFVIHRLNQLEIPKDSYEEITAKSIRAVKEFTIQMDGYDFQSPTRVKRSYFAQRVRRKLHIEGAYDPLIPEIVMTMPYIGDEVAHELVHSRGHITEKYVVFYTTVLLITSKDPALQFYGYFGLLSKLLDIKEDLLKDITVDDFLREQGVAEEIITLYEQREQETRQQLQEINEQGKSFKESPFLVRMLIILGLLSILVVHYFQQALHRVRGQDKEVLIYTNQPLEYLADYREKYLAEN